MLSGEGLKGVMLTYDTSSCPMLIVVGGILVVGGVGVRGTRVIAVWMAGGVEVDNDVVLVVDLKMAEGIFGEKSGHNDGYFSKKMWVLLSWRVI